MSVFSIAGAADLTLDFDGKKDIPLVSVKDSLALSDMQPPIAEAVLKAGSISKSAAQYYSHGTFSTENEAKGVLTGVISKFEKARCVIISSKVSYVSFAPDSPGGFWQINIAYIAPAGVTVQYHYDDHFRGEQEANTARIGIVKKLEAAGHTVVCSEAKYGSDGFWKVVVSYVAPAGVAIEYYYDDSFRSEKEANTALSVVTGRFESAGYVVVWGKASCSSEGFWKIWIAYILPAK